MPVVVGRGRAARHHHRGFTLVEVMVALAIVGIGVTIVLQLFSSGLRMETMAGTRARAVVYARGLLGQALAIAEPLPGQSNGEWPDGYKWEVAIREAPEFTDTGQSDLEVQTDVTMYEIIVSVLWPQTAYRDGVYTIRTLRVGPRPPQ
jgi:general secretion pathway protein I